MTQFTRSTITVPLLLALACCAQPAPTSTPVATANPDAPVQVTGVGGIPGQRIGTPAPGSRFSRVQIGMGQKEVTDLIGQPTDSSSHITGKQFIPFFFGGDTMRIEAHYKGEGILTFSPRSLGNSAYVLIGITVDRNERGYAS